MKLALCATLALAGSILTTARAQETNKPEAARSTSCVDASHTYYLSNLGQSNDANELQTALRNTLPPTVRIFLVSNQNALVVCATPDEQALVQKLIHDLDRPHKSFRLNFTITELDSGKRVGTQHYFIVAGNGQRTTVKQGSKVPIVTSTAGTGPTQTQFQYLDTGMNFDATFTETSTGGSLKAKIEQSSVEEEKSIAGVSEPIVRQLSFEGTPNLTFGKPTLLSSLDVPNTTRHFDVDVMVEEIK